VPLDPEFRVGEACMDVTLDIEKGSIADSLDVVMRERATLAAWRERLLAHREDVERTCDAHFVGIWELHLASPGSGRAPWNAPSARRSASPASDAGAFADTKRQRHRPAYSSPSQSRVRRCGVAKIKTNPGDHGDKEENENTPFPKRCDEVYSSSREMHHGDGR
jgi:hypothetical protein